MFNKEKLAILMNEKGMTQRGLAEKVGASQTLIFHILKGYKVPSLAVAKRIADYFEISLDEFME